MIRILLLILSSTFSAVISADVVSTQLSPFDGDDPVIQMHGAVELASKSSGGDRIGSLSALAWDEDEGVLYALSDNAHLYRFEPVFEDGKLVAANLLDRVRLRESDGDKLKGKERDSEGMHAMNGRNGSKGDSELLIAFEKKPRIDRFSAEGRQVGEVELPSALTDIKNYSGANHALEAVTWHPEYGVMTLPQRPQDDGHYLYSAEGRKWPYAMTPLRGNEVVSLETMPGGDLLVMERLYEPGVFGGAIITLRRGVIEGDSLKLSTLAVLKSTDGWTLENFEGLAHHEDGRYFMVSDNDDKVSRRTLLFYFSFK
ncbi:MAG: esterase-like activity of phytase family protein [Chromatiales bacterium]|jgi:hypothetical protein